MNAREKRIERRSAKSRLNMNKLCEHYSDGTPIGKPTLHNNYNPKFDNEIIDVYGNPYVDYPLENNEPS